MSDAPPGWLISTRCHAAKAARARARPAGSSKSVKARAKAGTFCPAALRVVAEPASACPVPSRRRAAYVALELREAEALREHRERGRWVELALGDAHRGRGALDLLSEMLRAGGGRTVGLLARAPAAAEESAAAAARPRPPLDVRLRRVPRLAARSSRSAARKRGRQVLFVADCPAFASFMCRHLLVGSRRGASPNGQRECCPRRLRAAARCTTVGRSGRGRVRDAEGERGRLRRVRLAGISRLPTARHSLRRTNFRPAVDAHYRHPCPSRADDGKLVTAARA